MCDNNITDNKLIKQCLGLNHRTHSTPLLKALGIESITTSVLRSTLDLLKSCVINNSLTKDFYLMLLSSTDLNQFLSKTLLGRAKTFCVENEIDISGYLFRDTYTNDIKLSLKKKAVVRPGCDGLIDSIRGLLSKEYNNFDRFLINNLLRAF